MKNNIDVQIACSDPIPIGEEQLTKWANDVLMHMNKIAELTIRAVDEDEITNFNNQYRKQNKSTNVLAFPANVPAEVCLDLPLLGDVIICPVVLARESKAQQKPLINHWAHIVTHGVLHLLGYDHMNEEDAKVMQQLEIDILTLWDLPNPYDIEGAPGE